MDSVFSAHRPVLTLVCSAALLGLSAVPALAAPPEKRSAEEAPRADAQARCVKEQAQSMISKASGTADGAMNWLAERGGWLKTNADDWRKQAEVKLKSMVTEAIDAVPPATVGVRVLQASNGPVLDWTALADLVEPRPARLILLVHGLDEPGDVWDELAPTLQAAGASVARFDYPNDQPIARSAEALAEAMESLHAVGVRRVDVVAHSMGGLVTRDVLTRASIYAGQAGETAKLPAVGRVIMIATPHRGSALARVRFLAEAREHFERWIGSEGKDPHALLGFLKDGSGEAGTDLLPDSAFLRDLNARPLPTAVKFTSIVGVIGCVACDEFNELLDLPLISQALGQQEVQRLKVQLMAFSDSLGDGIVSVESTAIPGVDDVVKLDANHRFLIRRPDIEQSIRRAVGAKPLVPLAIPVILDRLKD